mmetsp:Transcript_38865/g.61415  ORF Transcript_38865/g.61415 Transcript_38865/m.61415 type:complete len:425 (-) Transcript_38865:135-1409(-)
MSARSRRRLEPLDSDLPSRGSKNHHLGQCRPCRAFMTSEGCSMGPLCNFCHFEHDPDKIAADSAKRPKASDADGDRESEGSRGHPHSCQLPCKYFWKKGCKDGKNCNRCHLCPWNPQLGRPKKKKADDDDSGSDAPLDRGQILKENAKQYSHMDDATLIALLPKRPDGSASSIGSMLHAEGKSTRCVAFDSPEGCATGIRCIFCHLDHPRPPAQQQKRRNNGADSDGPNKRARLAIADESGNSRPNWLQDDDRRSIVPAYGHYPPPVGHYPPPGYYPPSQGHYPPPGHYPPSGHYPPPTGYYQPPPALHDSYPPPSYPNGHHPRPSQHPPPPSHHPPPPSHHAHSIVPYHQPPPGHDRYPPSAPPHHAPPHYPPSQHPPSHHPPSQAPQYAHAPPGQGPPPPHYPQPPPHGHYPQPPHHQVYHT